MMSSLFPFWQGVAFQEPVLSNHMGLDMTMSVA